MSTERPTIFISHISEEGDLAIILKKYLLADFQGAIDVFVSSDLESILAGDPWLKSIGDGLKAASAELILCSRQSITRPWVNFETGAAWQKGIPIVPVCHSGFQTGDLPIPYSLLHAVEAGQEAELQKLYAAISAAAGVEMPGADFGRVAEEVKAFESAYAVSSRMRGQAGSLIDLRYGERLVGSWQGSAFDLEVPDHLTYKTKLSYDLKLELRRRQSLISGEFHLHTHERDRADMAFIELINISGDYFYFKYWVAIPNANHCGFMVMELSTLGDELEGIFLTNKVFERQIGLGKIKFSRK
jgi:hypothetical protein